MFIKLINVFRVNPFSFEGFLILNETQRRGSKLVYTISFQGFVTLRCNAKIYIPAKVSWEYFKKPFISN
jgi:hypothetical protein